MALAWPSLRAATQAWEGGAGRTALAGGPQDHAPARQLFTSQWAQARARRTRTELAPLKTTVVTAEGEERPAIEPYTPPSLNVPALATILQRPALVVTRPIEWGTVLLGFEQANRYSIYDEQGVLVAHLLEEEGGIGRAVGRQLLRTRRPFTATVLNAEGTEILFRMRRPFYFINSSMFVEDGSGNIIGEVQQRWHLWRRNYDLYIDRRQFSAIEGALLAWDFELKDEQGKTLALIDRNFQGFGKELFTDAGRYAIHFGNSPVEAAQQLSTAIHAQHPERPAPPVTALARFSTDMQVIPTSTGNQLVVHRPLFLPERMVALAAAISIDYDFFSRHSTSGGGFLSPFMVPPILPYPVETGSGGDPGDAAEAPGAGPADAAEGPGASPPAAGEVSSGPEADDSEPESSDDGWLSGLSDFFGDDGDGDGW
ncbi:hypothetical protein QBZ16_001219 [Prototheca wickerhamii]|uniref:Phospholipid scramblase n=1 Tax=Prototheca wickerhamii TaxID=3111 RepID=A0AAD9IHL4_PROWI|nr:hypothetical protein QBZ16_001219 [Prototheca wickerhamii]